MTIQTHDFLAGNKYTGIVKKFWKGGFGIFGNTFGDAFKLIEQACNARVPFVRVQATWAGSSHKYTDEHFKDALKQAKKLQKLTGVYTLIFFSPFCEHKLKKSQILKYFSEIEKVAPGLKLVNTPMKGGDFINDPTGKYIDEIHINDVINGKIALPKYRFFASYDGINCTDADVTRDRKLLERAEILFFWIRQYNLRINSDDKTPPNQRKSESGPTQKLVKSVEALFSDKITPGIDKQHILKTHSDQHLKNTAADKQANKLVFISPVKGERATLIGENGAVLATSNKWVVYEADKTKRLYRFNVWGIDIFKKSKTVTVKVGSKSIGKVTPTHRDGEYRYISD